MDYPSHEFSKYIDNQFSFQGDVPYENKSENISISDRVKHVKCDGNIMLEPRLIEYLRKKEYYKKHPDIKPCINLEHEFSIKENDILKIKSVLRGNKDIYNYKNNELNKNQNQKQQYFPSKEFRDDKRVKKIVNDVPKKIVNRGMFVPEKGNTYYEDPRVDTDIIMDGRDFSSDNKHKFSSFNINESRFDPRVDERIPRGNMDINASNSHYNVSGQINNRQYSSQNNNHLNEPGNLVTRDMLSGPNSRNAGRSSGPLAFDFFKTPSQCSNSNQFSEISDMDYSSKMVIPKVSNNSNKNINTSNYMAVPYMGNGCDNRDVDLETNMLRGMPTTTAKSYGFRNPEEHYYNYVDPQFQNDETSVLPFPRGGEHTRNANRQDARKVYTRDIM